MVVVERVRLQAIKLHAHFCAFAAELRRIMIRQNEPRPWLSSIIRRTDRIWDFLVKRPMSTVPKHFITPEEYLHRERKAEFRSEYFRGEMFAMAGASANHNLIVGNCIQTIGQQLKKKPCRVYPSGLKLRIETTGLYTYPYLSASLTLN